MVEDPDIETIKRELNDAFRIYDKSGEGFITMDKFRDLISELLAHLTEKRNLMASLRNLMRIAAKQWTLMSSTK